MRAAGFQRFVITYRFAVFKAGNFLKGLSRQRHRIRLLFRRRRFAERFIQKGIGFDVIDRAPGLNINDGTEVHRIYDGEQKEETQQRKRAQRGAGTHNIAPACLELFGAGNMNQIKRQCRKKNNNHDIRRKQNKFRHHFKRILGSAIV